ncbi:MAG: hypothetical protein KDH20_22330 [Rhodocyclaceae bacterium]|nr:hypothetical protein [Rhodocyclaceae bacterium]
MPGRIIASSYTWWLLFLGPLSFVGVLGPWLDKSIAPVVDPFVVTWVEVSGGKLHLSGWMDKRRDCRLLEIYAIETPPGGAAHIDDVDFGRRAGGRTISRPAMRQAWGPWRIDLSDIGSVVTLRTRHACHPLWDTISEFRLYDGGGKQ